ncbi:MAG: NAD(P)-dependent oxidoreductase [Gammaproteobacteria bacterium]|nr:NAD(P)-dependent oxidoreductase [Gammaproteobacteria bacterium]QOJ31055.1 MAG: NAD(P)-dependent oxidoreductase [Gammaproteobacteria bacterium]
MKRVLLTGASGFIGSHCIAPLRRRGYEVVAICRRPPPAAVEGLRWVRADLLDRDARRRLLDSERPSHLLHLAWYVEPGAMISHKDNLAWTAASIDLLAQFHELGGERVVMGGSCYEYDWRYGYCSEELTPCRPDTLYGAAKHGLAQTLLGYCTTAGLSGAWARMFFLYGPNENPKRLVPSVILSLLRGEEAKSSHGMQVRDYMHVQDVADGTVALLDSAAQGAFNIASGRAVTIRHIVERLGEITGRADLLRIGAYPARANDAPLVVGDPAMALQAFGWQSAIGLDEGLRTTVEWWRARLAAGELK